MNNRSKYLVQNVGILTISNFASKILVFLLVPLYTNVLSTDEVGIYDLVVSTVSLMFPILTLNIVDAVMRFLMDKSKSNEEVASVGIRYVTLSNFLVLLILLLSSRVEALKSIHGIEILIFLYYLFYSFNQYLIQFAKGIEKVSAMGVAGVLGTVTMLTASSPPRFSPLPTRRTAISHPGLTPAASTVSRVLRKTRQWKRLSSWE